MVKTTQVSGTHLQCVLAWNRLENSFKKYLRDASEDKNLFPLIVVSRKNIKIEIMAI